jgi:hypothetical protein
MASGTLTSDQLKHILDLNSKSIEMNLEVSSQYDEVLKILRALEKETNDDRSDAKLSYQRHESNITVIIKSIEDNKKMLDGHDKQTADALRKIDRSILKQDIILGSSVIIVILTMLSKFLFGV